MKKILFLLVLTVTAAGLFAQQNPFLTTDKAASPPEMQNSTGGNSYYDSGFMVRIRNAQKKIHAVISDYIGKYKTSGEPGTLGAFLAFSFLYGMLHVLGPGHRKIFLFTYFISRPSRWKQGMAAGFSTAILHAVSAIILITAFYLAASRALLSRFNNITPVLENISYGAIIAIGAYLLIPSVTGIIRKKNHSDNENIKPDTFIFILVSGLVPCPGAAAIMIFSLSLNAPFVGVYAVLAMSLGMGIILALVPPAAILINKRLTPLLSKWDSSKGERLHSIIQALGAVFLIIFGIFFII